MPTIDPAGNAAAALYTPATPIQTPAQTAANTVTERPVAESNEPEATSDESSQTPDTGSRLGQNVDTTA